jgi:RNA polymerase sigma-70 factor (ECF subfamily)
VSETFIIAFRRRSTYEPDRATARAWLMGIATNLVRRHRRSEARRLAALSRADARVQPTASDTSDRVGDALLLEQALSHLDCDLRDVVLLVGAVQLTYLEAAAALGIPIGTVRSRMARARRFLRQSLSQTDHDSDEPSAPEPESHLKG